MAAYVALRGGRLARGPLAREAAPARLNPQFLGGCGGRVNGTPPLHPHHFPENSGSQPCKILDPPSRKIILLVQDHQTLIPQGL